MLERLIENLNEKRIKTVNRIGYGIFLGGFLSLLAAGQAHAFEKPNWIWDVKMPEFKEGVKPEQTDLFKENWIWDAKMPEFKEPPKPEPTLMDKLLPLYQEMDRRFGLDEGEYALILDGEYQKLYLTDGYKVIKEYDISTGRLGFGDYQDTGKYQKIGKTPTGIHRIRGKYGDGEPIGTVFVGRRKTGEIARIYTTPDISPHGQVLTRIMWLDGVEEKNKKTRSRHIYLHGTDKEGHVGNPASEGCVRLRNRGVIDLYNRVPNGTYVYIREKL